ncbi:MAG: c-type cytochrome [Gemmatimonadales bacterium]
MSRCTRVALLLLVATAACSPKPREAPSATPPGGTDATPLATAAVKDYGLPGWQPPSLDSIHDDSLGASVSRGLALLRHTKDSLPTYATSSLNCTSCHLEDGLRLEAAPLTGAAARFPKYMERTGAVIPLADRVNYCFTRSLAGNRLPVESREMQDILAYITFISKGVPVGAKIAGTRGILDAPDTLAADKARGERLFAGKCAACHGPEGQGQAMYPALWGPKSYSVGASMARLERAASFIQHNMPFGMGGTLSWQDAFDIAAYVNSHPRPDSPGKEKDWPVGGAPPDVPYDTRGHQAYNPPPLLPRATPTQAVVPKPAAAARERS